MRITSPVKRWSYSLPIYDTNQLMIFEKALSSYYLRQNSGGVPDFAIY